MTCSARWLTAAARRSRRGNRLTASNAPPGPRAGRAFSANVSFIPPCVLPFAALSITPTAMTDPLPTTAGDDIVLRMENVSKSFLGFTAVRDLSLDVTRGTIHAIIGPNGAGKTTVFNLATKFLQPTAGRIFFKGADISNLPPASVARLGMVRSFQISAVFAQLSVLENVRVALQRNRPGNFYFWRSEAALNDLNGRALELLGDVGLESFANQKAIELSYGRRRALEIATTLALDPELLLLDEPMSGLGQEDVARIADLIKKSAASRTVLMVEHNLSVVAELSDRITVLARGEILADGVYADLVRNPAVVEAYLGSDHG
jgi:branched-chain amino acid transport system ATP-binding protein